MAATRRWNSWIVAVERLDDVLVDQVFVRQRLPKLAEHGQPPDAGIEHTDRQAAAV